MCMVYVKKKGVYMVSSLSGSRVFPVLYFIINNINNK